MALSQLRTQALRLQSPGLPPWQLDVYGWGNRWDECQQLVSELGLKGSIIFHSPIPKNDLPAKLWTADIGLLTMSDFAVLEANSANKFYDYLAAGLPVLINYEGWQAQYLRQHACGWSTPQGNPEALAAQLSEALRCPAETRQAMGQRGRKLAVERFDRRDLALRTLELLTRLAKETKTDAGSPPNAA
jgi:glycosyltransferase involved in cell wall biosynthesis